MDYLALGLVALVATAIGFGIGIYVKAVNEDAELAQAKQWHEVYRHRLEQIVAQDTPTGNATVKRMVRIARGELN